MTLNDIIAHTDFHSNTWVLLKKYLQREEEIKIGLLLGESDHAKSSELRGAIKFIRSLLKAEEDARKGL
jgi:hypothetical protein